MKMSEEDTAKHEQRRESFIWASYGRNTEESLRKIQLKDITDSHLLHIIGHVINHFHRYDETTLNVILDEARYRDINRIFVDE